MTWSVSDKEVDDNGFLVEQEPTEDNTRFCIRDIPYTLGTNDYTKEVGK